MNNRNPVNVTTDDSSSFKYQSNILGIPTIVDGNGVLKNAKIALSLNYLSNFFRSLEMLLINCKIHLELNWTRNCVMSDIARTITFQITNTKLYVPLLS